MEQSESQISVAVRMPSSQYHHYHFIAGRSNFICNNHQNPGLNATLSLNAMPLNHFQFFHFPFFFVISQSWRTYCWQRNQWISYVYLMNVFNFLQVVRCQTLKWWNGSQKIKYYKSLVRNVWDWSTKRTEQKRKWWICKWDRAGQRD